ncbi:MAG TPA: FAD-dependent oxidoreductase [Roseiflexaceae bacterium]|nr:FAD-dependent oxidoreductase [Roseiflexaceae bacterium]
MTYDAIICGGGVVGAAPAYELVCSGARTLLIDRADTGRATSAGAGILSPATSAIESLEWFRFAQAAVEYYPNLIARLNADGAGDTGYAPCSELLVAISEDEDVPFAEMQQRILRRQAQCGTPPAAALQLLDSAEAQHRFPPLAATRHALAYRDAARVDGRLLADALLRAAVMRGLSTRRASVEQLLIDRQRVGGVIADGESIMGGAVVIAGGAWSPAIAAQIGLRLPIAPQRGQIAHLELPGIDTATWPVIIGFRGHYMVAWPDSRVVVGASRETGSGFDARITAAGVQLVLAEAMRVAPGLAQATLREVRVGLRPATADGLPVLGATAAVGGLFLATGHGANGLQLGPYSGHVVAGLVRGSQPTVPIDVFRADRFGP